MRSSRSGRAPGDLSEIAIVLLATAGLAFWFIVGLPWGPHNESFDWIVRLEQRSLWGALFERFPSVLGLRPLGTGPAWVLYRLGGHDVGLVEFVNAALALLAWAWAARGARELRLFSLFALVTGGVFFAGYIWVFHLHGIFYGPLLLYLAGLARAARGPLDLRSLLGVFVGALVTSLIHPFALLFALAFVAGATLETPMLRTRSGAAVLAIVVSGAAAAYFLVVPGQSRGLPGPVWPGFLATYRTLEVNIVGSSLAAAFAAWCAARTWRGGGGWLAGVATAAAAAALCAARLPVLPLWFAWAACKCIRRGRWTLAALVVGCGLLPIPNPTGSPTYGVFAVFVAVFASAFDEPSTEGVLHWLTPRFASVLLVLLVTTAIAVRVGVAVPVLSRLAAPLLAEGERTRQFEVLVDRLVDSRWRDSPARFVRSARSPAEADALDRRFRAPTDDHHLATWLDWKRGRPPITGDTLWFGFGGDAPAGMDTLLVARGRHAGDALVLRRSSPVLGADSTTMPR
jgi:hypothetical protein